jgi:uncharacterized OsmC-like protein
LSQQDTQQQKCFDIIFECDAQSSGKMRNDITVTFASMQETFELATDEGAFHGGDGSAPPPLALFSAAMAGCIMTQIRAFSKRLNIPIRGVKVHGRLHWQAHQTGNQPYVGTPVGFGLDIDIDSDAPAEDLKRLLDTAKQGCFIEQTLAQPNVIDHRLKIGGEWIAV